MSSKTAPARALRTGPAGVACATAAALALTVCSAAAAGASPLPAASAGSGGVAMLAPYYTELDVTGDRQVTADDLQVVSDHMGATSSDPAWTEVSAADADGDATITLADLSEVSRRIIYDDGPFDIVEASVVDMQAAMNAGVLTSVDLTTEYLDRIAAYDRSDVDPAEDGRPLNAVISTSAAALDAAAAADRTRAEHGMTSMLLGVPTILKDNYDTADMPTTAGCGCWDQNQTETDAAMVSGLREAGAVILAKASLDEFAYGFVSEFSAFQEAGSTLLVASPYVTSQSAGGSSGGTGAAVAANLAGVGFGTDTGGSIRVPSSYNQLVGIRPTVGLTSRDGIVPLALSQDTGGPIARSVTDAALALDAVVGIDEADPATAAQEGRVPESYTASLDADALKGARIGYVASMIGSNPTTVRLWEQTRSALEAAGATVVEVAPPTTWADGALPQGFQSVLAEPSGSTAEFRHDLAGYAATHLSDQVQARTIDQILASGRFVTSRESVYAQRAAVTEDQYQAWAGPDGTHTQALAQGRLLVTQMLDDADLDALVYPSGNPYSTQGTNLRLSPNTGMPAVTVPMGQAVESDGTIPGAGVNLEFLGRAFDEPTLLGLAYSLEQSIDARTTPALYPDLG
jgi:Asp-tRNA(Asn)/Glu-tRNA(Gln) amidotransferase A subunit family amidase